MNEALRRSAAHVVVDDVEAPELGPDDEHHLARVLRLRDGQMVTVTDGVDRWRVCRWRADRLEPDGDVETVPRPERPFRLHVAIPKQDRPEWLVQKATELGVDEVVFLHAERSVVRWSAERAERHLARLRRVATEAAMQSRRVAVPTIAGPVDAREILRDVVLAEPGGRAVSASDRSIAIGPEGGWSDAELAAAHDVVSLGPHVLRVETAALAACVLVTSVTR